MKALELYNKYVGVTGTFILLIVILLSLTIFTTGCTSDSAAKETLTKAGFTNIQLTGWDAFGCSDDDLTATRFTATNYNNLTVDGTVCCGIFKRCTIRY